VRAGAHLQLAQLVLPAAPNAIWIGLVLLLFVVFLFLPFRPTRSTPPASRPAKEADREQKLHPGIEDDIRKLHDCGEEAVVIVDDPPSTRRSCAIRWTAAPAAVPQSWPPQRLAPDAEPIYVKNWFYTMGVATLAALILLFVTGILWPSLAPTGGPTPRSRVRRRLHYWSVELFFLFMALHFISTFLMGAFRGKRWATWMLGVLASWPAWSPPLPATPRCATSRPSGSPPGQGRHQLDRNGSLFNLLNRPDDHHARHSLPAWLWLSWACTCCGCASTASLPLRRA